MRRGRHALTALMLLLISGCSSGPPVAAVSGRHAVHLLRHVLSRPVPSCSSRLSRSDQVKPQLVRQPDGVVLLSEEPKPHGVRANAGDTSTRWVGGHLPARGGRQVVIVYTPHPDDETLSAGVLIAEAVARGERVVVVALTDGVDTRARIAINSRLRTAWASTHQGSLRGFRALTPADIGAARVDELRRAATALGVVPTDVFAAHLDAAGSDCGAIVSVHEADQVERAFSAHFPGATHVTTSYDAERQQDHLAAGIALQHLLAAHVVSAAEWTVSRLWWSLPSPAWRWVLPTSSTVRNRVLTAGRMYQVWNPAKGEYAVGAYSVHEQFRALQEDPRDRVHRGGRIVNGYAPRETA